jgi:hypothetical protein
VVVPGQGFAVLKKAMHGTYISYCRRAAAQFLALQRPLFSLYVLISTRQCLSSAVLAPLTPSFDLVVLPI